MRTILKMGEFIKGAVNPENKPFTKSWAKFIRGVDIKCNTGYAFEGEFIDCKENFTELEWEPGDLMLLCQDIPKENVERNPCVKVIKVTDGDDTEIICETVAEAEGLDWVVKIKEALIKNLVNRPKEDFSNFLFKTTISQNMVNVSVKDVGKIELVYDMIMDTGEKLALYRGPTVVCVIPKKFFSNEQLKELCKGNTKCNTRSNTEDIRVNPREFSQQTLRGDRL